MFGEFWMKPVSLHAFSSLGMIIGFDDFHMLIWLPLQRRLCILEQEQEQQQNFNFHRSAHHGSSAKKKQRPVTSPATSRWKALQCFPGQQNITRLLADFGILLDYYSDFLSCFPGLSADIDVYKTTVIYSITLTNILLYLVAIWCYLCNLRTYMFHCFSTFLYDIEPYPIWSRHVLPSCSSFAFPL